MEFASHRQISADSVGIPQVIDFDKCTVVSGIDGTVRADDSTNSTNVDGHRQRKQSNHEAESDEHAESTRSEDTHFARQRRFLEGVVSHGQHRTSSQGQGAPAVHPIVTHTDVEDSSYAGKKVSVLCGVDFSKRSSQVVLSLGFVIIGLAVSLLFATDVFAVRPGSEAVAPTLQPTPPPATGSPVTLTSVAPSERPPVHVAQWVQVGADIDGEAAGDWSGFSLALSSDGAVVAVGALFNDFGGIDAGHVRVYANMGGGWIQLGDDLDGASAGEEFGFSVALAANGTILAVGARLADGANGVNSGQVRLFRWNGSGWGALGSTIDGEASNDEFGYSVALSDDGTVLAAGAWDNDGGGSDAGNVRIFTWNGTDWSQRGNDLVGSSANDDFGRFVALSSDGSTVASGGHQPRTGNPGYVRVFRWNGAAWLQQGSTLNGFGANDEFGTSVSLSGDGTVLAIGADDGNYCIVYEYDGTDWFQLGQTIGGIGPRDLFGFAIALSFAGDTFVVGGPSHDALRGHALVYRLSSSREQWVQVGQEVDGESVGDRFGRYVSISDHGSRIAIGAYWNSGNGNTAGHVRVFDIL